MANMSTSAITHRILLDLEPVVAVTDKIRALNDILLGVEGFQDLYWGNNIEALSQLEILLLWSSPSFLNAFEGTMEREALDDILQSMSTSNPITYRLSFSAPSTLLCSPVVELLLLYNVPASTAPSIFEPMEAFIKSTDGCLGIVAGPAAEDDDGDEFGIAFLLVVGWESMEANEKGAKSERFKNLPRVEGAKISSHHVRFQKAGD